MAERQNRMAQPVLCIGAAHWDVIARSDAALAPGADLPGRIRRRPGGVALNIALGIASTGLEVRLLSAIGRDAEGTALIAAAEAAGVTCAEVLRVGSSDAYLAIEGPDGAVFAAVAECRGLERAGADVIAPLSDGRLAAVAQPWRGRLVIDGNLPEPVLARLVTDPATAEAARLHVPASPAKAARLIRVLAHRRAGSDAAVLNRAEAEALTGRALPDAAQAALALCALGLDAALVTDGARPVAHAGPGGLVIAQPRQVAVRSLTGAGDRLAAAHLAAETAGLSPQAALEAALDAVARHITREEP